MAVPPITFKRGSSFSISVAIPSTIENGAFHGWVTKAQMRKKDNDLAAKPHRYNLGGAFHGWTSQSDWATLPNPQMETIMEPAVKAHYFLIAGVILFAQLDPENPEAEPQIGSAPVNAIVRHDATIFPARKLGKAQQNLHKSFVTKLPAEAHATLAIHDIVVTNVSYLGHMTEEEFQEPEPEVPAAASIPDRI